MGQPGSNLNERQEELEYSKVSVLLAPPRFSSSFPLTAHPRHLARFSFQPTGPSSRALNVQVFPIDRTFTRPFFSATIQPITYTPSFPFSSSWLSYLGMSTHILQPPLPEGKPADAVVGTSGWLRSHPVLSSNKARLVWFDMRQPEDTKTFGGMGEDEGDALLARDNHANWWPELRRWHIGICCLDATLELGEPRKVQDTN